MMDAPAYRQTLKTLNDTLRAEIAALESGDISVLESSTPAKLAAISALQLSPIVESDAETDALIREGAELCEQAALRVNLLLAGVERRLAVFSRAAGHAPEVRYGRNGRMDGGYRSLDLDCA